MDPTQLAALLRDGGGWGVAAIFGMVIVVLFKALRQSEQERISDTVEYGKSYIAATSQAIVAIQQQVAATNALVEEMRSITDENKTRQSTLERLTAATGNLIDGVKRLEAIIDAGRRT